MSAWLSTHLLDINSGNPADGVKVELRYTSSLEQAQQLKFDIFIAKGCTDINGRISGNTMSPWIICDKVEEKLIYGSPKIGYYQLKFYIREYFIDRNQDTFWPIITVEFEVNQKDIDNNRHFHVPYLFSNYGLTTYRGSSNTKQKKSKL